METTTIGFAITGSFCTLSTIIDVIKNLIKEEKYKIIPIFSFNVASQDTRFFKAEDFKNEIKKITDYEPVNSLQTAEPLGPSGVIDVMVVAPCTGNTLAKLANGITDTPVTMAVKSQLRNNNPVVLAISTNDGLGLNLKNIGILLASKNIYFVPFGQDNPEGKPNSLASDYSLIGKTIKEAKNGHQLQPIIQ
ncbi:MAG: dipicolinate synthase subunit B [Clostridia bacterium]|nr:dipicolinate synthase subunit B [Clostridia bacterium]MDD3862470.1 dipicolinate synthase subunit B [Clostridia bacterium]